MKTPDTRKPPTIRSDHRHLAAVPTVALAVGIAVVLAAALAPAQGTNPFGLAPKKPASAPSPQPPPPPASPVIARVAGRPITQSDFDRIAGPYFDRLRAQMGSAFNDATHQIARRNVLDELIRREVLIVEAQRRGTPVTDDDTDYILRMDPSFTINGRFEPSRLAQFKFTPGSNYPAILPHLRELAAANKLDSLTRSRLSPKPAEVRAEWKRRVEQTRFQFLSFALRDVSLEPESDSAEQAAYYAMHPEQFMRRPRAHLRYVAIALPAGGDSTRADAESTAVKRGRGLADSLRAGIPFDTVAAHAGGALDCGPFDLPPVQFPGLGRVPALTAALAHADSDSSVRVAGPAVARDQVVVGVLTAREPRRLPPFSEVQGEVRRRADQEKRRAAIEADRRTWYTAHPDSFRTTRCALTRVVLEAKPARPADAARALAALAAPWRAGRDVRALARAASARVETLSLTSVAADSLFPAPLVDSLVSGRGFTPGTFTGPRDFGKHAVLWRVDAIDSAGIPPLESVRGRVDQFLQQEKRAKDEGEALVWYGAHRAQYRTRPKVVLDWIAVKIPLPDSVTVPEAEVRRHYDTHGDEYRQEEEVRARHILISNRPEVSLRADPRALADSLVKALRAGADFADLARRFSADPGSAPSGGDLGFFPRGRMVPEFNDASFSLPAGQVSDPVKTTYGFHIIKVEERHAAGTKPFDAVRVAIRTRLAQALGDSSARRTANTLRRRILAGGSAAALALPVGGVHASAPFAAGDPVPELGAIDELAAALATLPLGRWAPQAYRSAGAWVLVRPSQRIPEAQAEFEEVTRAAVEDMKNGKRRDLLARRVEAIRSGLAAGATLDSLSASYGGLKDSGPLTRGGAMVPGLGYEPRLIERAFAADSGQVTDTLETTLGMAWIRPAGRSVVAGASLAKDSAAIEQELFTRRYSEWIEERRKAIGVQILRADLKPEPPAPFGPAGAARTSRR